MSSDVNKDNEYTCNYYNLNYNNYKYILFMQKYQEHNMDFIDRENELKTLTEQYNMASSSFVVIYGRRRVGKTALISEFIKDKNALYYMASQESETESINAFKNLVAEWLDNDLLRKAEKLSFEDIFLSISNTDFLEKPIIVIDEFQYLCKGNPAFASIFQRIWDTFLKDKNVMVIICGSLIPMMITEALSYSSPLYGRRTAQIMLKQVPFKYYQDFFSKSYSRRELVERYAVTGGVPKYIISSTTYDNISDFVKNGILNKDSYLYAEPQFLLQQEVSEIGTYFSILKVIAAGNHKLSEIANALEQKATGLTKYLNVLTELDVIYRKVPVTEKKPEISKKGLYYIGDNYIEFWFKFVYPYLSFIETNHTDVAMKAVQKSMIKNHTAYVYENICRERMWDLCADETWPFLFTKVGSYWDKNQEIDIVAHADGDECVVGECKFYNEPVDVDILYGLMDKVDKIKEFKDKKIYYVLFSISGFTEKLRGIADERDDVSLSR